MNHLQITHRSPLITHPLCTRQADPATLNSTDSVMIRETGCLDMAHCLLTFCHTACHVLGQSRCNRDGGNDNEASEQTNWASEMPVLTPENLPWMPATIPHITSRASGTAFRIYEGSVCPHSLGLAWSMLWCERVSEHRHE